MDIGNAKLEITKIINNIETVIIGKTSEIELILCAFFAGGHVLLEDVPGTGKTMLAKALARSFSCDYSRVQFTPDLLPSDLTGINFYNPKTGEFNFRKGSLFANILLADEINRATPRTQSGLLESMEEKQITVDGKTYALPLPYFTIATQNPIETQGTFPLPEAQLDRFLIQLSLGYPSVDESVTILRSFITDEPIKNIGSVCTIDTLLEIQKCAQSIFIHSEVYRYIINLAEATRNHDSVALGVSTRGCIALARLSQALALTKDRNYVTPDDIKYLLPYAFSHRLILRGGMKGRATSVSAVIKDITDSVTVPVEDWKAR